MKKVPLSFARNAAGDSMVHNINRVIPINAKVWFRNKDKAPHTFTDVHDCKVNGSFIAIIINGESQHKSYVYPYDLIDKIEYEMG